MSVVVTSSQVDRPCPDRFGKADVLRPVAHDPRRGQVEVEVERASRRVRHARPRLAVLAGASERLDRSPRTHVAKIGHWGLHHTTSLGSLADGLRCA